MTLGETLVEPCYTPLYAAPEVCRLPILVVHFGMICLRWCLQVKIIHFVIKELKICH